MAEPELDDETQFEQTITYTRAYQETSDREIDAVLAATERIRELTTCDFLVDAYIAATNVRNVLGDGDAYAAQQSESIRRNLVVVLSEVVQDPASFVLKAMRASADTDEEFYDAVIGLAEDLSEAVANNMGE